MIRTEAKSNQTPSADDMQLTVDGAPAPLTSDHTIGFVERLDSSLIPVLYHCGQRVRGNWSLKFDYEREESSISTSHS